MQNNKKQAFTTLSRFQKLYNLRAELNETSNELDSLFDDTLKYMDNLQIVDAERRLALEQLRSLTTTLQTKRLRTKTKSSCKYFTL